MVNHRLAFVAMLSAWCFGYGLGAGASWWALVLGGLGVVSSAAWLFVPRRDDSESVEVSSPTAKKGMHGPIEVRVVTTTMRDVEGSK